MWGREGGIGRDWCVCVREICVRCKSAKCVLLHHLHNNRVGVSYLVNGVLVVGVDVDEKWPPKGTKRMR